MNPDLLIDIDIGGTPDQIAAARLERVVKNVLLSEVLSPDEKPHGAFSILTAAPLEVVREVIRQTPALLVNLKSDSATDERLRAEYAKRTVKSVFQSLGKSQITITTVLREVFEQVISVYPLLEPQITADTRVAQIGTQRFHGYDGLQLPFEFGPYLLIAFDTKIAEIEAQIAGANPEQAAPRISNWRNKVKHLQRVKQPIEQREREMTNILYLLKRREDATPQQHAQAVLDFFSERCTQLARDDNHSAYSIGNEAKRYCSSQPEPDMQALTPMLTEQLLRSATEPDLSENGMQASLKHIFNSMLLSRFERDFEFTPVENAALQNYSERFNTFYLGDEKGIAYMKFFASLPTLSGNLIAVVRRIHPSNWEWYAKRNQTQSKALELKLKASAFPVSPGELWSDAVLRDLEVSPHRATWLKLLDHANSTKSKPDAKWESKALELIREIPDFEALIRAWMSLVGKPRTFVLLEGNGLFDVYNANILRGLLWGVALLEPSDANARGLADVVLTSLKKVPGVGPRSPKIATAGVFALGRMNSLFAVGQLARLKTRVTFKTTLKEIEKALENAATRQGVTKADLEELSVPSCGLESVGAADYEFGDVNAELRVVNSDAVLTWFDANRKVLKNPPSSVKKDFADDLKDLKTNLKDLEQMLSAQSVRLERFVLSRKSWDYAAWKERYLEHPLVGCVARRLIWTFTFSGDVQNGIWHDGQIVDSSGQAITINPAATVSLWHPMDSSTERVLDWRGFLEQNSVVQPWKQAHREIYILTAAEERTDIYSNRFAAHVLKQHQFAQLAALRGWNNQLRLMVDASYSPPTLELPQWGLRAEFWVDGAGDDYGVDTTEAGTYLYLTTDQVRFYATGSSVNYAHAGGGGYEQYVHQNANPALPLRLETIPALVLSEVLRDVDLFVGVTSVGNDPAWNDGGPQGRYREYWQSYSFGVLSDNALNRKALLETLIPRLKIRDVTSIQGKFLHVKGSLREYKIHMGSGNILMLPNDQYLCIVPGQSVTNASSDVQLPFEGDRTLAVILSKAFMLADDKNIKDATITTQIRR